MCAGGGGGRGWGSCLGEMVYKLRPTSPALTATRKAQRVEDEEEGAPDYENLQELN